MDVSTAQLVASTVASGGLGSGLTALLNFMNRRQQVRSYALGAVDQAVKTALDGLNAEVTRLHGRVKTMEDSHEQCEAELAETKRKGDQLQRQIDALMAGAPAPYAPDDLKRV